MMICVCVCVSDEREKCVDFYDDLCDDDDDDDDD